MNRTEKLQALAQLRSVGHVGREGSVPRAIAPSTLPELDAALPGGGWQSGTIVELMSAATGIGELRLLMPALAQLTRSERHVALIAPPFIPFAPALAQHGIKLERLIIVRTRTTADTLWAFEQALRCHSFGAVLAWPDRIHGREIRRLQLAAEAGRSIGFLYREAHAAREASPAALRLKLQPQAGGELAVEILKCRSGRSGVSVHCAPRQFA